MISRDPPRVVLTGSHIARKGCTSPEKLFKIARAEAPVFPDLPGRQHGFSFSGGMAVDPVFVHPELIGDLGYR